MVASEQKPNREITKLGREDQQSTLHGKKTFSERICRDFMVWMMQEPVHRVVLSLAARGGGGGCDSAVTSGVFLLGAKHRSEFTSKKQRPGPR